MKWLKKQSCWFQTQAPDKTSAGYYWQCNKSEEEIEPARKRYIWYMSMSLSVCIQDMHTHLQHVYFLRLLVLEQIDLLLGFQDREFSFSVVSPRECLLNLFLNMLFCPWHSCIIWQPRDQRFPNIRLIKQSNSPTKCVFCQSVRIVYFEWTPQ